MDRVLALILAAVAVAASQAPAVAGSLSAPNAGGTPISGNGVGQPTVVPRNYTLTPQAAQPLGNYMYLGNGMVVPRSTNYFFTWQGRPCQTLNGTTFCQ